MPYVLQKTAFHPAKDGKQERKRPCFAEQKTVFCNTGIILLAFNKLQMPQLYGHDKR